MKRGLFYITMIFSLVTNAYATEPRASISILGESMENGSVSTLMFSAPHSGGGLFAGLSLSYITSSDIIQHNYRKKIYPIYIFMGLRGPWKLSPFVELGGDLADVLLDDLRSDKNGRTSEIDYYYSGGLTFSVTDKLSILLYAKKYNFLFRDYFLAPSSWPVRKLRPTSYGMGISMGF